MERVGSGVTEKAGDGGLYKPPTGKEMQAWSGRTDYSAHVLDCLCPGMLLTVCELSETTSTHRSVQLTQNRTGTGATEATKRTNRQRSKLAEGNQEGEKG